VIDIYGTSACQWCKEAQLLCIARNEDYTYHQIDVKPELLEELEDLLGTRVRTVPQILIDGVHIGGYSELKEKLNG